MVFISCVLGCEPFVAWHAIHSSAARA